MGCNCNKNGARPHGSNTDKNGGKSQQQVQREGAKSMTASAYILQKPDGGTELFSRQLDANAARVRAGGGTIRPIY